MACDHSGGAGSIVDRANERERAGAGAGGGPQLARRRPDRDCGNFDPCHATEPVMAFAGRGLPRFCWRCLTKMARQCGAGQHQQPSRQHGRNVRYGSETMSDAPGHGPVESIMPKWIKGPQDFIGGIAMMAIAVFALWASSDLQGMHGFSFGAGTAPRMFAVLLLLLGAGVALTGLLFEGAHLSRYHWPGPL